LTEVDALANAGPAGAARALVHAGRDSGLVELDEALDALAGGGDPRQLRAWWFLRMLRTRDPFREKLALFLHGHFATGLRKVGSTRWMALQVRGFLDSGAGPFGATAAAVVKGPAMLLYLDATKSERRRPNENLARELLELFMLGRGNYAEHDVKEAARALTGWRVDGRGARLYAPAFDDGEKTVLGVKGSMGADELVALCASHPACAAFLSRKLLAFFAAPDPPEPIVEAFARILTSSGLAVGEALLTLYSSRYFYSQECYRALVKSPVEYAVGALRALGGRVSGEAAAESLSEMGQALFDPPSVKGWDGGRAWMHAATWLARAKFAFEATSEGGELAREFDSELTHAGGSPEERVQRAVEVLLQGDLPDRSRDALGDFASAAGAGMESQRALLEAVLLTPEYHCN
jgi:uncharacterized protein (DUF1800 family)